MSSAVSSSRVRKACLPCIRAKAKCSPSEHHSNGCQRCMRLNKDCTYEVLAKKPGPGPKSRSRVRQLEQRVESLIDLLHTKNTDVSSNQKNLTTTTQVVTPESSTQADTTAHVSPRPDLHQKWIEAANFRALDPVTAGLIEEEHAYRLVRKFQESFVWSFPFVVIDTDGPTLRQQEPFLFHAILTVTANDTPPIQHDLSESFRRELGRLVEYARKSLGILQGLLVYGGWYHGFYHPASQQLSTVVQLCVAMVQDLGYSTPLKRRPGKFSASECSIFNRPSGSLSEKRAFLGTWYLSAVFNHAWRKRTTLSYTRFVTQCCAAFEGSPVPSDILISPLVKTNELLSRVNDHFSYSDIDNADIKGDMILEMSTTSFVAELDNIRGSIASNHVLRNNTTLKLLITLVIIGIHEVCLHSSLWNSPPHPASSPQTMARLKMLHRTMEAAITYMNILLDVSQTRLYQLGLGTWSAWFYTYIVICKLVFLEENERLGYTNVDDIPGEINNLMPHPLAPGNPASEEANDPKNSFQPVNYSNSGWDALAVTRQYGLREISQRFTEKLSSTLPADAVPWKKPREDRDSLYSIACLHYVMFQGYTKRLQRHQLAVSGTDCSDPGQSVADPSSNPQTYHTIDQWQSSQIVPSESNVEPVGGTVLPFASFMNFDSINFDGFSMPSSAFPLSGGDDMLGDWVWNMAMDDFTMPTL